MKFIAQFENLEEIIEFCNTFSDLPQEKVTTGNLTEFSKAVQKVCQNIKEDGKTKKKKEKTQEEFTYKIPQPGILLQPEKKEEEKLSADFGRYIKTPEKKEMEDIPDEIKAELEMLLPNSCRSRSMAIDVNSEKEIKRILKKETRGRCIKYSPEDLQNYENLLYDYIKKKEPCPVPYQQPSLTGGLCDIYSELLKIFGKGYIIDLCLKSLQKKGLILKEKINNANGKIFVYRTIPEFVFSKELLEAEEAQNKKIEKVYPPAAQETIERNFEEEESEETETLTCHCGEICKDITEYISHTRTHEEEREEQLKRNEEEKNKFLSQIYSKREKKQQKEEEELNNDIIQGIERRKPTSKYQCPGCKNPSIIKTNEAVDDYLSPTIEDTENREVWKCMACSRMYYTEEEVIVKKIEDRSGKLEAMRVNG